MKRKTINDFKIKNYRTVPILEQTKSPFGLFDNSDSKKIYNLIEKSVFALKHGNTEAEQARLQRFSYLLCEEIKSNFQELLGDEKTIKKFKTEITKKITENLNLDKVSNENLFTETDVALAVESAVKSLTDHKFLEKYINVLSEKDTEKVIKKFSEELSTDSKMETSVDNLLKNPLKSAEVLNTKVKNLVASTATATKLQDNIAKLSSEIEEQGKKKEEKKKSSPVSPSVPSMETPPTEPTQKSSLFGNLFKFSALGITAATAARMSSMFNFGKKKKEEEGKHESLWTTTKSKLTFSFFKITNTVSKKFKNALNSVWEFGKKSAGAIWKLLKYTSTGILKIITSPFTLLFSGLKKVFWEDGQSVSANVKQLFKRLVFSASFFYFLGMMFGLIQKLVMAGFGKAKEWWGNMKERAEEFKEWVDNFKENWKTILSEKLAAAWNWIRDVEHWKALGTKIGGAITSIFPEDMMKSLKELGEKLESSWKIIKEAITNGPIHWVVEMVKSLKGIIDFIRTTSFGASIMSIAGAAWKVVPSFLGKIIALGMGIVGAIVPAVFVKLFKGWGDEKKAYDLDDEYRRSLGVSIEMVGHKLTSQFKDDTSKEVQNSVEDMIKRNITTGTEISEYLGGSEHEGSIAWWKAQFEHKNLTYRNLTPDVLNPLFSFGFISNDKKGMQVFNILSTEMMDYFLHNKDLDDIEHQYNFLTNLTLARKQYLMFISELMQHIGLTEFTSMLKDSDNYLNPLYDILMDMDYKKFHMSSGFSLTSLKNKLYNLQKNLTSIYKSLEVGNGARLNDLTLEYHKGELYFMLNKRYPIWRSPDQYSAYLEQNDKNKKPWYKKGWLADKLKYYSPETLPIARNIFLGMPYDIQSFFPANPKEDSSLQLSLDKFNAFDYMIHAIDSTTDTLNELKLNPDGLENYSWDQMSYILAGEKPGEKHWYGTKMDRREMAEQHVNSSEKYLFDLLWRIFDAATTAGVLQ